MKYIVNTGCSYGVMPHALCHFTDGNDEFFRVIDLHVDGMGSEYQKRSIIYVVDQLLKYVKSEDIYVIVEWSQPGRLLSEIPIEFCSDVFENLEEATDDSFVVDNTFSPLNFKLPINLIRVYKSLNAIIGNNMYTNWDNIDLDSFRKNDHFKKLSNDWRNLKDCISIVTMMEKYLQDIVDLQNYLTITCVYSTMFLMNNTFEGWDVENGSHYYTSHESLDCVQQEKIKIKNLFSFDEIKDFSEYCKFLWNSIDFDKFVFYKTDRFQYGGIDEYAMEQFGHIAYTSAANPWDIPKDGSYVTSFGGHPHNAIYVKFFEEFMYEKIKSRFFVGNLEFDYDNMWDKSKHHGYVKPEDIENKPKPPKDLKKMPKLI